MGGDGRDRPPGPRTRDAGHGRYRRIPLRCSGPGRRSGPPSRWQGSRGLVPLRDWPGPASGGGHRDTTADHRLCRTDRLAGLSRRPGRSGPAHDGPARRCSSPGPRDDAQRRAARVSRISAGRPCGGQDRRHLPEVRQRRQTLDALPGSRRPGGDCHRGQHPCRPPGSTSTRSMRPGRRRQESEQGTASRLLPIRFVPACPRVSPMSG